MDNLKRSLKNRIVIAIAVLFIAEILISVMENVRFGTTIVKYSFTVVLPYMIICISRLVKMNSADENKKIIKNGIILFGVLQAICFVLSLLISEKFPNGYFGAVHFINWIFLAVPLYLLIVEKFDNNIKILPFSFIVPAILTYDCSISTQIVRNIICYFPFFLIGWNFDSIIKKMNKRNMLLIGVGTILLFTYSYINMRQFSVSENLFDQYVVVFFREKFILYALPILLYLSTEWFVIKNPLLNKDYKFRIITAICGLTILSQIIGQFDYHSIAIGRRFMIAISAVSFVVTLIFALIPIERLKLKEHEEEQVEETNGFVRFLNSSWLVVCFVVILMLKTVMFYYNTVFMGIEIPMIILGYNLGYILVLLIPIFLTKSNKARYIEILIWDLVISTVLFADELYFSYSRMMLSINQIYNAKYITEITSVTANLLKFRQVLYYIDIIVLIVILIFVKFNKLKRLSRQQYLRSSIAAIIILYIFSNDIINLGLRINESNYSNDYQVQACTIYGFHINDIQNFLNNKKNLKYKTQHDIEDAYAELKNIYTKYDESYKGIAKGNNVIIVQLEAIQEFLYGLKINGREVTPHLNEFLNENIHFTNMHAQSYTTTADSEFSVVNSLYPLENGLSFAKYFNVDYDDIFTVLKNNGYYTSFFHGNDAQFWNRGRVYKEFGLDEVNFIDSFEEQENVMWYLSDRVLYKEAVTKMEKYQKPFMATLVSASSHTPFTLLDLDKSILTIDVGKYKDTFFGDYLEAVNYADMQFGYLINMLKENGIYDNSVIIIFGDHYGMPLGQDEMFQFFKENGTELNPIEDRLNFTNVLAGLHIPGLEADVIDKPISKIDVKPTVLSLLGIEDDFSLGISFFSDKDFVCTNAGTIITGDKYFDSVRWYDIESGAVIDLDSLSEDERKKLEEYVTCMELELNISKAYPVIMK